MAYSDKELIKILKCKKEELEMFKRVQKDALKEAQKIKKHFFQKEIRILGISGATRRADDCPHSDSHTDWLLEKSMEHCKKLGAKIEIVKLWDYNIQPCKGCYSTANAQCHYKCSCYPEGTEYADDMTEKIYDKIMWADAIIFATPTHNFKISSPMSLFLDRCISMDGSLTPANPNHMKDKILNIKHTKFVELTAGREFGSGFLRRFTGKTAGVIATGHEIGLSMAISSLYMTLTHFGMVFPPFSNMYATGDYCQGLYADEKIIRNSCHEEDAKQLAENVFNMAKSLKENPKIWWEYSGKAN
ncbi:MAG: flavodoxin family protein [Nanoarchaeota archaeon]|nr:flavodoxin family protein [Nanoarchaeota archaeon]